MKRLLVFAPFAALGAGCSSGPDQIEPGYWESTVQYGSIEMPGAPADLLESMREAMAQPQTNSTCISAEQAADPIGQMLNPSGQAKCDYAESTFSGGSIRLRGTCHAPGEGTMQISMDGSYSATTLDAEISTETSSPTGADGATEVVRMSGNFSSRRTGDCPEGQS